MPDTRTRNAYVGDVNGKRPDVRSGQVLHHHLIFDGVADDKDDETFPFQVQGQRPGQGQRW